MIPWDLPELAEGASPSPNEGFTGKKGGRVECASNGLHGCAWVIRAPLSLDKPALTMGPSSPF
ncbi:hypothetical protein AAU01_14150 [Paenarthrobacter aurescens]|uniref:Uncharacterized protein n=1 Tax=Paenarthrobacter aurescens TaxID=43663 RepID=A0A4Y3N9X5_PAEAU|nr:hypothetical protein AAU01_14150 [Paenarthrobacter aurescens]